MELETSLRSEYNVALLYSVVANLQAKFRNPLFEPVALVFEEGLSLNCLAN